MNKFNLTIGIPTRNSENFLELTLKSVSAAVESLPKSKFDYEFIICLDHCTDNTKHVAKKAGRELKLSNFRITTNDSKVIGKAACLNKMARIARGNILVFIDDDISLDKSVILDCLDALIDNNDIKIVFPISKSKNRSIRNPWRKFWHNVFKIKFEEDIYKGSDPYFVGRLFTIRKKDFIILPNNLLNEDQFLYVVYYPNIRKITKSAVYFYSVKTLTAYFGRFFRIRKGTEQVKALFPKEKLKLVEHIKREIEFRKVFKMPIQKIIYFLIYRLMRILAVTFYKLYGKKKQDWFRASH